MNNSEVMKGKEISVSANSPFAELMGSEAFVKTDAELPIIVGKDENGAILADLSELPHLFVYSAIEKDLNSVLCAAITTLIGKCNSSQLNCVLLDLNSIGLQRFDSLGSEYFWTYPSQTKKVVDDQPTALRILNYLVKEIDNRCELLRTSRTHNRKEYCEAMESGRIVSSSAFPNMPNVVVFVSDYWRLVNESKAAEISLGRLTELGKSVGIFLVAVTAEQPELMNIDVLSQFPSRLVFKTNSPAASQALLFASDAANLQQDEAIFVKNKYFFAFKNTRKIMTEGSIDVDFANKVTSSVESGLSKITFVSPSDDDINQFCTKH